MKYDAIVGAGIPIIERVELPDELIPEDSKVRCMYLQAGNY